MNDKLLKLEIIFLNSGYTQENIEEIKHMEGATETENFIDNLENEKCYWE